MNSAFTENNKIAGFGGFSIVYFTFKTQKKQQLHKDLLV